MTLHLEKSYSSMKELYSEIEKEIFSFRYYGVRIVATKEEAISTFLSYGHHAEEVKEEVICNKDIIIGALDDLSPTEVNVLVTAFFVDPGSDDYVYVVSIDEYLD